MSYVRDEVFGKIDFDLPLSIVFAMNKKTTLGRQIDSRTVDIRQPDDAESILC